MDEKCKDCVYMQNVDKRVSELEDIVKSLEDRVKDIEKNTAVSDEQIKMIFKILNEIKDSIKQIADKIDEIEKRPARRWDETIKTIVTVAVTAVVTFL